MSVLATSLPVISPIFQAILDSIGWILAQIYSVIGNYGVSIILLTILVRVVLLPLGIKQIQSMHNMQSLQPKIKALQTKYKGNKQRQQEEIMKLYRESGVNPLSGCWPVLLQFPILIAMYAVIRPPIVNATANQPGHVVAATDYTNNHLPPDSELFDSVTHHTGTDFLTMNLQCAAIQSGTGDVTLHDSAGKPLAQGLQDPQRTQIPGKLDCGQGFPTKIPYFAFLLVMVGTTFYQQRQMQKVAPPGATNSQQQALFKIMPLMFGIFGISFPAGLVVYWTTSNVWQIGQQYVMLRLGHIGPNAKPAASAPRQRPGWFAGLLARMEDPRRPRDGGAGRDGGTSRPKLSGGGTAGRSKQGKKPASTNGKPDGSTQKKPGSGGGSAGNRKKRPKR
jgi:YidC/Oxa1 family membrane protein insertase